LNDAEQLAPFLLLDNMMKRFILLPLAVLSLAGCLASTSGGKQTVTNSDSSDSRECARNFTYDGSFLAGRTYKTKAFVKNVNQADAMKRAARYIAQDGWQVNNTDQSLGIISASQTVSYGQGKTAPLSASFEQEKGGVQMGLSYSTSGGVTSPVDAVQKFFCSLIEAAEGKK